MSRHHLKPKNLDHDVVVGWDPPLATFFALVQDLRAPEDDDPSVHWAGWNTGELPTVERLAESVAPYAEIPMEMRLRLAADRIANTGFPREESVRSTAALSAAEIKEPDPEKRLALLQATAPAPRGASALDRFRAAATSERP